MVVQRWLVLLALFSVAAQAQTPETVSTEPGNLPAGFYPAPPCAKPVPEDDKGGTRELGDSVVAVENYHRSVERYNKAVVAFNGCAKTYIQNSRYDIERILSTVNAAVAEVQGTPPPAPPAAIGNLPADFYPRSPCVKPDRESVGVQPAMTDLNAMRAYNLKVEIFNQQAAAFGVCLKAYQDRAQHDIEAIRSAVEPAPVTVTRLAHAPAPPVESIVVTGASSEAVNHFVQAAVTPTHIIGKVARWETAICPAALGLPDEATARVVQRVKDVAAQAHVPVSTNPVCTPNIVIAFTSTPQALLDNIRKDHREWLGYQSSSDELDRLSTVTRPIQAWYSTATVDLEGHRQIDSSRTDSHGPGLLITGPCYLLGGTGGGGGPRSPTGQMNAGNGSAICTKVMPNAIGETVAGSRVSDGLRATFDHVTLIANPPAVQANMTAIDDYIAVLALAQISSLDTCQALPSITSLLAPGCAQVADSLTANDLGYLKAVYAANPEKVPGLQKDEIAYRMEQGIAVH
jgi:hypothetical protein